ncbi:MAG: hypothetical protein GY757_03530, partial [bacterium]|nr:hypothetical protein [bacterium]
LLGDTPGIPTTGLLYIASYLRRSGVDAVCRFYDENKSHPAMKEEMETLMETIRPRVLAISMKWFPYMNRVLDMIAAAREYADQHEMPLKIVVGGNTASYYWEEIIQHDTIDYVVCGDGELPLLKICRNETEIPNCVYKKNGRVIQTPFTYIKDKNNSSEIYLSHMDEIMMSRQTALLGTFFIYTHLGCNMNCFYCGGCNQAQQKAFNRKKVFIRPAQEVQTDILAVLPYVTAIQWDFDIPHDNLEEYCRSIWDGIDLTGHFCFISTLAPPSQAIIQLAAQTFKYVYWDLDTLTLSQRQRIQLVKEGIVKPQPTDKEILAVLNHCDPYQNTEVRLNLITGLPCFLPEDIESGHRFLARVMSGHRSFSELHSARLHAQPGAPILENAGKYEMNSYATTYDDFIKYARQNFNNHSSDPDNPVNTRLEYLNYPYIYYKNDTLNSTITRDYTDTNKMVRQYRDDRRLERMPAQLFTYENLNDKTRQWAGILRTAGVEPGTIVAIMLPPS